MDDIVTTDELKEMIDEKKDFVLIDVRSDGEVEAFDFIKTLKNAKVKNVNVLDLVEALALDPPEFLEKHKFDKPGINDEIVVYCRTGSRSGEAMGIFREKGYTNVRNYDGSVEEWSKIDPEVKFY